MAVPFTELANDKTAAEGYELLADRLCGLRGDTSGALRGDVPPELYRADDPDLQAARVQAQQLLYGSVIELGEACTRVSPPP